MIVLAVTLALFAIGAFCKDAKKGGFNDHDIYFD
ncbi:hypothetical protein [Synechococcus phage S-B68]|jgi:hypothetical protein|nr:hypothetical protein [Synechococcus phage S-B68]